MQEEEMPKSPNGASLHSWQASEFIEHAKKANWFTAYFLVVFVFTVFIFFITRDWMISLLTLVMSGVIAYYAGKKPRVLSYGFDARGITVGEKLYPYDVFSAFSTDADGEILSIVLFPSKRFMPPMTIHVEPDKLDDVIEYLGNFLPFDEDRFDRFDHLVKKIRF